MIIPSDIVDAAVVEARLADAFATCSTTDQAATKFKDHGFCVLAPSCAGLNQSPLMHLKEACVDYAPHECNIRDRTHLRYSLNCCSNIFDARWRDAVTAAAKGPVGECLRKIAGLNDPWQRVHFDIAGGDVVHPGGVGQDLHSDDYGWRGGYDQPGTIAVSFFVDNASDKGAPIRIVPKSVIAEPPMRGQEVPECLARKVLAPIGAVLIRDVNVWHSGTANETEEPRYLPGFRIFTAARLGDFDWRPQRTICDFEYDRLFPDKEMNEFFAFVWRPSTDAECHHAVCRLVRKNAFSAAWWCFSHSMSSQMRQ
jgi:hypothetical protein